MGWVGKGGCERNVGGGCDVGYGGCEPRVEGIGTRYKKVLYNIKKIKKNVWGRGRGNI